MARCRETYVAPAAFPLGTLQYATAPYTTWWNHTTFSSASRNASPSRRKTTWDELHAGPPYAEGGPLNIWTFSNDGWKTYSPGLLESNPYYTIRYRYNGMFVCDVLPFTLGWWPTSYQTLGARTDASSPGGNHPTWGNIESYGATAWKKYRPGKATADAAVFIGEIRDFPRMLRTTARGFRDLWVSRYGRVPQGKVRKAADHWLNTQFGWLPFLSDLRKFYKTYKNADATLQRIIRYNGQWERRGGSVARDISTDKLGGSSTLHASYPELVAPMYSGTLKGGSWDATRVTSQRVWFKAAFRYYIPNIQSVEWKKRALAELFGATPNPALLWELTPWSWLVDWFSNVGDVFSNMDTGLAQNLTAKYAYVMGTKEERIDVVSRPSFFSRPATHTWSFVKSRKSRVKANPFGFSLTWDMLSARQWSILSALGITRLH